MQLYRFLFIVMLKVTIIKEAICFLFYEGALPRKCLHRMTNMLGIVNLPILRTCYEENIALLPKLSEQIVAQIYEK